ncbi:MAG: dTMP kinase [Defluviitaleaceae bacterium]|nr:dTMP kinase [Defluviitaleaceae bacterium]
MFVVIEGLDGSGKSTQTRRLGEWFTKRGVTCLTTNQPSNGTIGTLAREVTKGAFPVDNEALSLLFAAEHLQHYKQVIEPALNRGEYVICDRYYYSNLVYQGKTPELFERILSYNYAVMNPPAKKPDAVIYLDAAPEECMRRITANRAEISIFEKTDKLKALRNRYNSTFEYLRKTEKIITIQTENLNQNQVYEKIVNKIAPLCST